MRSCCNSVFIVIRLREEKRKNQNDDNEDRKNKNGDFNNRIRNSQMSKSNSGQSGLCH